MLKSPAVILSHRRKNHNRRFAMSSGRTVHRTVTVPSDFFHKYRIRIPRVDCNVVNGRKPAFFIEAGHVRRNIHLGKPAGFCVCDHTGDHAVAEPVPAVRLLYRYCADPRGIPVFRIEIFFQEGAESCDFPVHKTSKYRLAVGRDGSP